MHDMKLGEVKHHNDHTVLRVPGGWVYVIYSQASDGAEVRGRAATFVPYSNEFKT